MLTARCPHMECGSWCMRQAGKITLYGIQGISYMGVKGYSEGGTIFPGSKYSMWAVPTHCTPFTSSRILSDLFSRFSIPLACASGCSGASASASSMFDPIRHRVRCTYTNIYGPVCHARNEVGTISTHVPKCLDADSLQIPYSHPAVPPGLPRGFSRSP